MARPTYIYATPGFEAFSIFVQTHLEEVYLQEIFPAGNNSMDRHILTFFDRMVPKLIKRISGSPTVLSIQGKWQNVHLLIKRGCGSFHPNGNSSNLATIQLEPNEFELHFIHKFQNIDDLYIGMVLVFLKDYSFPTMNCFLNRN
jgi:hypothetical protein